MRSRPVAAALLLACSASSEAAPAGLTGDWNGARTQLAEGGIGLRGDVTGFAQGLLEGSGRRDAATTGRWDLFADLDLGKLASAEGFGFHVHGEGRFGESRASFGGQLWPSSAGSALPLGGASAVATSLYLSKSLGDRGRLMLGRINALDLLGADPVIGGWGSQRFMHFALVAPPSGVVPPTIFGGVLAQRRGATSYTLMVFDPEDRTRDYGLDNLFSTGVNVSLGATRAGNFGGRASSLGVTATVSTKRGADLEDVLAPPGVVTDSRKGSYNVSLQATQRLVGDAAAPGKGLDLLVKAAIADGNPNLVRSSLVVGLVGTGLVQGRPEDRFGVGAFYYDFSNVLQDSLDPLVDFRDEAGLEAWYGISLTPWASLSVHLQAIDPARGNADTAVVGGLRLNVRL